MLTWRSWREMVTGDDDRDLVRLARETLLEAIQPV